MDHEALVNKVKGIQKMPGGHDLWTAYVMRLGGGKNDPSLRESWELSEFLSEADPDGSAAAAPSPAKGCAGKGKDGKKGGKKGGKDTMGDMWAMMEAMGMGGDWSNWGGGKVGGDFSKAMDDMWNWMMGAMDGGADKGKGKDKDKGKDKGFDKGKGKDKGGGGSDELVARVKAIQRMEGGKELWCLYIDRIGGTMRDPARRSSAELEAFLNDADPDGHTVGAIDKGKGKGDDGYGDEKERMPKYVPYTAEHANLIARVKAIQKKQGNDGWSMFCERQGGAKRDPASRTPADLEAFLREADPEGATIGIIGEFDEMLALVHQIKSGCRMSEAFKELWQRFCDERANGLRDPSRHPVEQLRDFMRMAPEVPQPDSDPEHIKLVDQIKQGQRTDEGFKQAWWKFCEEHGSKMMDPSRHEKSFLESFLAAAAAYGKAPRMTAPPGKGCDKGKGMVHPYGW